MHFSKHSHRSKILLVCALVCLSSQTLFAQDSSKDPDFWNQKLKGLMMDSDHIFLENQGQWEDEIRYRASSEHSAVLFYQKGLTYSLRQEQKSNEPLIHASNSDKPELLPHEQTKFNHLAWHWDFIGASEACVIKASDFQESNVVRFQNGRTTPTRDRRYAKLSYEELYPGINLDFYTDKDHNFKYDFAVKAGSNPDLIQIAVRDVEDLSINLKGEPVMSTS